MSRYLTYLSKKFDQTIDSALAYDKTLDEIEIKISNLKQKVEDLEMGAPEVIIEKGRTKAG